MNKSTLVLGASPNPARYAWLAAERLQENGHDVYAFGKRAGTVAGLPIETDPDSLTLPERLDTITLYLNPAHQEEYYDWILALHPKRVIFNPGTENPALEQKLRANEIEALSACTLVLLATRQY